MKEVEVRSILSKSKVLDYSLNPYLGCEHGCTYCYARFMKRFTDHGESWGEFVDVKINAPSLLKRETRKKMLGRVWISGVCDPYQPLEEEYGLTRSCLKILSNNCWPVTVQTKSPLLLRDIDLFQRFGDIEVGLTITTAEEETRRIFEPKTSSIEKRLRSLEILHSKGFKTYAMIAPLLPGAEGLVSKLIGKVDYVLIDRMNYHYADQVYRTHNLEHALDDKFFSEIKDTLSNSFKKLGIPCQTLF